MATKLWAICLVVLCTVLTSTAQIFYKFGAQDLPVIFTNIPLLTGLLFYMLGAIVLVIAFKGGEVSTLYPVFATSFIWVSLMSNYFFDESLSIFKWLGIFSIIIGISLVSYGSKKDSIQYVEPA